MIDLRLGDCIEVLKTLPDNSVDSIVTDPPYHLTSIVKRFGKEGSSPAQYGTDGAFARALMEYLIKLVTPKGGIVLEPFMGSGSTGIAAKNLGMSFIGIEREEEYFEIAKQRIKGNE
jgi:DNA modification methylase